MSRTVVVIRPEVVAAGMDQLVLSKIRDMGWEIVRTRKLLASRRIMKQYLPAYGEGPEGKEFDAWFDKACADPIVIAEVKRGGNGSRWIEEFTDRLGPADASGHAGTLLGQLKLRENVDPAWHLVHVCPPALAVKMLELWFADRNQPKLYLVPGGVLPRRMSSTAVGLDAGARDIVTTEKGVMEMPPLDYLRKSLWDFRGPVKDPRVQGHVVQIPDGQGGFTPAYRLDPGKRVQIDIGFVTALHDEGWYWVTPRSGLASVYGVTCGNAPGTVDSDYRGVAGVILINHGSDPFDITYGMRIAQIVFQPDPFVDIILVDSYEDLPPTERGAGGFGSTGLL